MPKCQRHFASAAPRRCSVTRQRPGFRAESRNGAPHSLLCSRDGRGHQANGKTETVIEPVKEGMDIQSNFFDMWRQEHADADLEEVPADMMMASNPPRDHD